MTVFKIMFMGILVVMVGLYSFALTVDWFPGLSALYEGGSLGGVTLPDLLKVPAPLFALAVVIFAIAAFVGAEKVERVFQQRRRPAELTPRPRPRTKFALGGAFAIATVVAMTATSPRPEPSPTPMRAMEPLTLTEAIIARRPDLVIVDVRIATDADTPTIPGALRAAFHSSAVQAFSHAGPHSSVVVYDEEGAVTHAPEAWPRALDYHYIRGGFAAWQCQVLTPVEMEGYDSERRAIVQRQNQIAAYFSGAAVEASVAAAPPPPMPAGGAKKKKKAGGC
jgi:rhodanese-related sulfurtransferase